MLLPDLSRLHVADVGMMHDGHDGHGGHGDDDDDAAEAAENELRQKVQALLMFDRSGLAPHPQFGYIGTWDVSLVRDFSYLFNNARMFNADLSGWSTRNATNMQGMFFGAKRFEGRGLHMWDTENVVDMTRMFYNARVFQNDIRGWRTDRVTNNLGMFHGAIQIQWNHPEYSPFYRGPQYGHDVRYVRPFTDAQDPDYEFPSLDANVAETTPSEDSNATEEE